MGAEMQRSEYRCPLPHRFDQHRGYSTGPNSILELLQEPSGCPESCHPNPWPIPDSDRRNPKYSVRA
jgi:hypothetical protein